MSLCESIQTNKVEEKIQRGYSEIRMNRIAPIKDYSHSITARAISQDTTKAREVLGGNDTGADGRQTERRRQFFDPECIILKPYQLIFLDESNNEVAQDEPRLILQELRTIASDTKFINSVTEALQFIEQTDTATFLVCCNNLAQLIAPQTQILKNLRSIYVYDHGKQDYEHWFEGYTKVNQVYTDLQSLLNNLNNDIEQYLQQMQSSIFSEIGRENFTTDITTFSWWNYLISMLCHLTYPDSCLQTFVMTLRNYYHERNHELKILDDFEKTYTSQTAIYWYTRNTFFFHLINKALRQKNIEVIFLFGFFIKDIYVQLKNEHGNFKTNHTDNPIVKVYRGQIISLHEIQMIEDGADFITNSFLSTSFDQSLALFLVDSLYQHDDELKKVLFEIQLDTRLISQPFGHISNLSHFPDENEVLFMIGTSLKVVECSRNDSTDLYLIKLELQNDSSIKQNYDFIGTTPRTRLKSCVDEILGNLYRMSLESIDTIFIEMGELFLSEKGWLNAAKYDCLAKIYLQFHIKHYPEYINITLATFKEALTIYQSYLDDGELGCAVDISRIYLNMAFIYDVYSKDKNLANKQLDLGIATCASSFQTTVNIYKRMNLYDMIVSNCEYKRNIIDDEIQKRETILEGIRYRKLQLEEILNYSQPEQLNLLHCVHNLAELQNTIGFVTEATMNYEKVVEIYLQQSEPNFSSGAEAYGTIAKMYSEQKKDYASALDYRQKELECRMKNKAIAADLSKLGIDYVNTDVADVHLELADIYIHLSQHSLAYENLIISKQLYDTTDVYGKETKLTVIEEKIRDVIQFLSQSFQLTEVFK